jgi:hypothetical protein
VPNPLHYQSGVRADYERRAAAGYSHVLYVKSPGGVEASARRTAAFRPAVERAASEAGVDPDLVEALVFLESGGRPEVIAGGRDPRSAAGLTQILASTATSLLAMHVDVAASARLGRQIAQADLAASRDPGTPKARAAARRASRLRAQRRRVDERFDPDSALAATGRYLKTARERFGREDLAFVSYHMGIGNLTDVIDAFGADQPSELPYAELYFDSSPLRHRAAYARLAAFGDDSSSYYWRLLAAKEIMRLYRSDPGRLARNAQLQSRADSAAFVLHPKLERGNLVALPKAPAPLGYVRSPAIPDGEWKLRPAARAALSYLAAGVRAIAPPGVPLTVAEATSGSPTEPDADGDAAMASTGWAFAVARRYSGHPQAEAVQFMLDRLQAMNVIAWARDDGLLRITAAGDATGLEPWVGRGGKLRHA